MKTTQKGEYADIVLIGAGIMSATLGMLLKQLQPDYRIEIFERLDMAATESSDAWNNAGTGHSAFCELNYTPELPDGSIDISKAIKIAESFEVSKQFWAWLVENNILQLPGSFIRKIPHMTFVWDEPNIIYLKKRYNALQTSALFDGMECSNDREQLMEWIPLMMNGRSTLQKLAATKMEIGTDVNFGSLTRNMFNCLQKMKGVTLHFNHEVRHLTKDGNNWRIKIKNRFLNKNKIVYAGFTFIGAGGGSLPLLLKSGIPESKGYGGFPISGQWLKCKNPEIIEQHHAKVYGKASLGSPPMSVPHLDTRFISGKKELLFGPYAGFTGHFLKKGSWFDLIKSIRFGNIRPLVAAGFHNIPLTRYLIKQVRQSPEERLRALQEFFPNAKMEDWELVVAGERVQVIKKDPEEIGVLEFGTEVVNANDGSLAALLGASPGASTAVSIMLSLLQKCFPVQLSSETWQLKLRQMIPSYGQSLGDNRHLCEKMRTWTAGVLGLK